MAQWIVITKANPDPGLDTSRTWFIPGSDTRSHRFRLLLVTRRAIFGEIRYFNSSGLNQELWERKTLGTRPHQNMQNRLDICA
jgi:hypothetical protein